MWDRYRKLSGFALGFHGCDEAVGEQVLRGKAHLKPSHNDYDWLGSGIYFWEDNPARALEFARQAGIEDKKVSKGRINKPFVLGAVLDLGLCCNLLDSGVLAELQAAHSFLAETYDAVGLTMPVNRGEDRRVRFLDRAVVMALHDLRMDYSIGGVPDVLPPYDSVRAAFWEGGELYPGAGFAKKSHIQIAVRNPDCIKGYFRPLA